MKKISSVFLVLLLTLSVLIPAPADAGGGNGWAVGGALLGVFLLGSVLGSHDKIVVGPIIRHYPQPVYYPTPVVYQPQPVWIPDHYELRWMTTCQLYRYPYPHQNCYQHQVMVFIPGHWEHR